MSTIKINELATASVNLTDFFAKADANGLATKNTIQELATVINTSGDVSFQGSLAIADTPSADGWYFASESGTYTNAGSLVVDVTNNIVIIIVSGTQTVFSKVDIPISLTLDTQPTEGSSNTVDSDGIFKFNATTKVFQPGAVVNDAISQAFLNCRVFGADKNSEYSIAIVKKNETGTNEWRVSIFPIVGGSFGTSVANWIETSYTPSANVEKITLSENNNSGITAEILVKWDEIPDATALSGMDYDAAGLDFSVFVDEPTISVDSKDNVFGNQLNETNEDVDILDIRVSTNEKYGQTTGDITTVLQPSENTAWNINNAYDERYHAVRFIMTETTIQNRIQLPFRKNYDGVDLVGDIIVKIGLNGVFFYEVTITNAELVAWGLNAQTTATLAADCMYNVDIPNLELNAGDDLYIAWGCVNAADKLTFQYDNNDPTGTYYADRYIVDDDTDITTITRVPTITNTDSWTFPVYFQNIDYLGKKILDTVYPKTSQSNVEPDKIYTVCNDIVQTDSGFDSVNYSAVLYTDHLVNLTEYKNLVWEKTNDDKLPIFSPIEDDNSNYNGGVDVLTTAVSEVVTGDVNDITVEFDHISTKASVGVSDFPKVLFIGDSVTGAFLANRPTSVTTNNPTAFWSYTKKLFYQDYLNNGSSGHQMLSMGVDDSRTFDVEGNTVKAYAEGKGGWNTRDFLYSKDFATDGNRFYDSAKVGTVKFSVTKYLERYKTLADDGVTRLSVGTTAGTEVTDVNAYDLCTPTHIVIQFGFNDIEANWSGDIDLMIAEIQSELPSCKIIISTIDAAGTYFTERYPMLDKDGINMLGDSLHTKMYNLITAAKAKEDVPNNVFYCPNYFVQPTAWAVPYREVNEPGFLADPNANQFIFKSEHGAGPNYHPNTFAHASWGYQIYSILKYTLTLP
jgi:hypothetical protein